jgi:hypothetical protein
MLPNYTNRVITGGMSEPLTVSGLIEKLTPAALQEALGVGAQAISNMKQRGAIPPRHWPVVVELAKKNPELKKLTWNDLVTLHTPIAPARHAEQQRRIPRSANAGAA